jgi:16S rRNA (cytosine967-C5)-methyltransferase
MQQEVPVARENGGSPGSPGRQILAGDQDMDGFYYARLTKT